MPWAVAVVCQYMPRVVCHYYAAGCWAPAGFHGHAADLQFPNAAAFAEYSNMDVAPSILIRFGENKLSLTMPTEPY